MDAVEVLVSLFSSSVIKVSKTDCSRIYMVDGIYQSVVCFFMGYLLVAPATSVTENGLVISDRSRMGVFIACGAGSVVNLYIILNSYRWDWLVLLIVTISTLLIWFWTGVYSSFTASFQFYKAGAEVFGTLNFWLLTLIVIIISLLPRFSAKFIQKNFFPLDVDIIREQVRQGVFNYLDEPKNAEEKPSDDSTASSDVAHPLKPSAKGPASIPDSERPLYPPSEATTKTRNPRSQNSSDGTDKTKPSLDLMTSTMNRPNPLVRPSFEATRRSYERSPRSMDRLRPSFEGSRDFTSAALLSRVESSHSPHGHSHGSALTPSTSRMRDLTSDLQ